MCGLKGRHQGTSWRSLTIVIKVETIPRKPVWRGFSFPPHRKLPGRELTARPKSAICWTRFKSSLVMPVWKLDCSLCVGFPALIMCLLCCISIDMVLTVLYKWHICIRMITTVHSKQCKYYLTMARYMDVVQQYETPFQNGLLSMKR